jgi:serine/threonine kinase PknH
VSDKVGPDSSQSQSDTGFDRSAWHQGDDDAESSWTASQTRRADDVDSGSGPNEPEQGSTYGASDSPPPVIDAFPEHESPLEEPLPEQAADSGTIPWPITMTAIGASLVVVVLVIVIIVIVSSNSGQPEPTTAAPSTTVYREPSFTTSSTVAAPPPSTSQQTVTVTVPPPATTTPTYDSEAASLQQLQQLANTDRQLVYNWTTYQHPWVPQLSSKKLGTRDNGMSYNYERILQDFLQLRQQYPSAHLLRSGDWSTFDSPDYWVTVADWAYPTASGALAWCRNEGLDDNHCYAKLISTTHGVDGSTAHN